MTTIFFIRHAQADHGIRDGRIRPLTDRGHADCRLVTEYLRQYDISAVLSSPFRRAIDTVAEFAAIRNLPIEIVEDFREQKSSSDCDRTHPDFDGYLERQWSDFSYRLSDGECLEQVETRNVAALRRVLSVYENASVVIGTHGTALSTIMHFWDRTFTYRDFLALLPMQPCVVKMDFRGEDCIGMERIRLVASDDSEPTEGCQIRFYPVGELKAYRFSVVFARHRDKWVYCRGKNRIGWETAGGNIEEGETPLEGAERELREETGAERFTLEPAFDFTAHVSDSRVTWFAHTQVFYADIQEFGAMPDYEMKEIGFFDAVPNVLRFPQILPALYERMQFWLNLQSAKDEIWDVYDKDRRLTGRTHRRADPLAKGDYHLVVHVWIQNQQGEYLITQRAPNKGYPFMWECTGGSAVTGDDSITTAIREVYEETGLGVSSEMGSCLLTLWRDDSLCDVWLFRQNFSLDDVVFQEMETINAKYASAQEIRRMVRDGEFVPFTYIEDFLAQTTLPRYKNGGLYEK